jgi:hypothetical protein
MYNRLRDSPLSDHQRTYVYQKVHEVRRELCGVRELTHELL